VTFKNHPVQPPHHEQELKALSNLPLNASRDGASTTPLDNLFLGMVKSSLFSVAG